MYPPKSNVSINTFTHPLGTTVDRFIVQKQQEFSDATGELTQLLRDIVLASKIISRGINRAGLSGIEGLTDDENVQGEKQRMLDVIADVRLTRALVNGQQVAAVLSEEREGIIDTGNKDAKYGSLVCDFHRNLLKGGIYLYPPTSAYLDGKLRLLYECNALAMISEQAGGLATDGNKHILEIDPKWHHQRVPFYAGSKSLMEKLMG